ncbi:hypothetical protein ACWEKM_24680 [Streptomyces sp. NPDC004752]
MSASPSERGLKRFRRRSAPDHNKAGVTGGTPVNMEATPGNSPAVAPAGPAAAMPALIVVPGSPGLPELVTALVAAVVWAVMAWRSPRAERPRP